MEQRISLTTLGVKDLAVARAFYEAMGWTCSSKEEGVVAFDIQGSALGLYPIDAMAKDIGLAPGTGFSGVTMGYNVREKEEVAQVLAAAKAAGGTILKEAEDVFWGGHHGFFADPDGHVWEVAHNPFSPLGENGEFQWNGVQNGSSGTA